MASAGQLREKLRAECRMMLGQKAWATAYGFSAQYVCDVLKGRREISEPMAAALGFRRIVTFSPSAEPRVMAERRAGQ